MRRSEELTCRRKDSFGLICGYPLPCPHHTVVIDLTGGQSPLEKKLNTIKDVLKEGL